MMAGQIFLTTSKNNVHRWCDSVDPVKIHSVEL
jgi:hypothetical protein